MFRLIQAYSAPCVNLAYLWDILVILWALAYLEPEAYLNLVKSLPGIFRTLPWALLSHIQNLMQRLHMQKPGLLKILEYSKLFHKCISIHTRNPFILPKFTNIQEIIYEYSNNLFKTRHIIRTLSKI